MFGFCVMTTKSLNSYVSTCISGEAFGQMVLRKAVTVWFIVSTGTVVLGAEIY